jgi:outer membrane protein assembly complex protein YaeT
MAGRLRRATAVLFALLAAAAAPAHAAVGDYVGKPVAAVHLLLEGRETGDPELVQVVETQPGQPLSMMQVRESIAHLFSLGRFEDVRVEAALGDEGVALRYELTPIHPVYRIDFTTPSKAPGVDLGALRKTIVDRYGLSPTLGRATDMAASIEEALREKGYLHAKVTPHADTAHEPHRARLVFNVDPGARTLIDSIDIEGTPSLPVPDVLKQLGIARGAPYQRDALNASIEKYVEGRRRRGYYEAKVASSVQLADGDRAARLTLTFDPGRHMRVVFAGDPLPADRRSDLVPVEREGSADEDLLEDSTVRIEEFLRTQGYRDAVAPHSREESDRELVITFNVRKGPLYVVQQVDISGADSVSRTDFAPALKVHIGEPFSDARLDADVAAIEDVYRRRGFPAAKARSAIQTPRLDGDASGVPVAVRIVVSEGARTIVGAVTFKGNESVPDAQLRPSLRLQTGTAYFAPQLAMDREALAQVYANLGYQNVTVDAVPNYSSDRSRVDPLFTIREGPRIFVDHVLIVGNVRTSSSTIEQALGINPGDPLSTSAVNEAETRLAALGLFRRTRISELRHGEETKRDLLVTVEEAPATTIGYGGGFEVQQVVSNGESGAATTRLEFAPRASFEVGRRNLFGKNRSLNLFTSVSEHLQNLPTEYRVIGTYREPRLFDTAADAFVTGTIQQINRTSFSYDEKSATATVARHLSRDVSVSGNYQIQRTNVFRQLSSADPLLNRLFANVLLSSFSGAIIRDTRSDPVDPHSGEYLSGNAQIAGRSIGSAVGFAKSFFTAETFRLLPHSNVVFAGDARLGVATGFPQEGPLGTTIRDLPQSERFYAGGDTTVRGFALDTLGVRHTPPQPDDTIDVNGFPVGGNAVMILNAELRAPIRGGLGVVGFVDAGNVWGRAVDIDLGSLRTAVGFGVRYKSPVGPLRFDLGFKLHRDVVSLGPPVQLEKRTAFHISLGQAF